MAIRDLFQKNKPQEQDGPLPEPLRLDPQALKDPSQPYLVDGFVEEVHPVQAVPEEVFVQKLQPVPELKAESTPEPVYVKMSGRVFMAGSDDHVATGVRTFLQKCGMQVVVPHWEGHGHRSIVEQFQTYSNFDFAIVVLSADELMFQRKQDAANALFVASQETVFELGFLVGKLGRARVAVFNEEIEKFKRPTEYFDVLYTAFDQGGHWQEKLVGQMKLAGITPE